MTDIFANDLFEIHGTHISISAITDFRLKEIEYIMRPVYYEKGQSKWGGFFRSQNKHTILFDRMDYYAAIIGEEKYKNAIDEAKTENLRDAVIKTAVLGITDIISNVMKKPSGQKIRYRLMNAAGRISERTLDEIPAVLWREDGKQSEVFPDDELYPLLGEPIAPTIVTVPALYIMTKDGKYVFFGEGIQVDNIEHEYNRLKLAIKVVREMRKKQEIEKKEESPNLIENIIGQLPLPFFSGSKKKEPDEIVKQPFDIDESKDL